MRTDDIITTVTNMRSRGVEFLTIPESYYDQLQKGLEASKVDFKEDFEIIKKLKILVDYDDKGYLL